MSATIEQIQKALSDNAFDREVVWVIKWQFRLLGDFETALAKTISLADEKNLDRLVLSFPVQVNGFMRWKRGSLAKSLRDEGLDI